MADTAITTEQVGSDISYRASQMPVHKTGSFAADDTDSHAAKIDGRGKGRLTYGIDNLSNKTATVTLYGMFSFTGEVGDTAVYAIDSTGFTVAATSKGYETNNDFFPYYLIRVKFAATPDSKTVTVHAAFGAF